MSDRIYTIDNHEFHGIFAGIIPEMQLQALVVDSQPREMIVAVLFNLIGEMIKVLEIPYVPIDENNRERRKYAYLTQLDAFKRLGLEDFTNIHVKKFWVKGHYIGIMDYPLGLHYLIDAPETIPLELMLIQRYLEVVQCHTRTKEESDEDEALLETWLKRGDFVLWAGREDDYWADDNGIHAT